MGTLEAGPNGKGTELFLTGQARKSLTFLATDGFNLASHRVTCEVRVSR